MEGSLSCVKLLDTNRGHKIHEYNGLCINSSSLGWGKTYTILIWLVYPLHRAHVRLFPNIDVLCCCQSYGDFSQNEGCTFPVKLPYNYLIQEV